MSGVRWTSTLNPSTFITVGDAARLSLEIFEDDGSVSAMNWTVELADLLHLAGARYLDPDPARSREFAQWQLEGNVRFYKAGRRVGSTEAIELMSASLIDALHAVLRPQVA